MTVPFRTGLSVGLAIVLLATATAGALAADAKTKVKKLGSFDDWRAFSYEENGHKVCYMSSQPKKLMPKGAKRGDAYVLVTHRPAEKSFDVVQVTAGYTFKSGGEVMVETSKGNIKLFTDGDSAWARDEATDRSVVNAIRNGAKFNVKGVSGRGTSTTDTYSLKGASKAYDAINEACGKK
jgi:hypothetical protein